MTVASKLHAGVDKLFREGKTVSVQVYATNISGTSVYDDDPTRYTSSGAALTISGLVFPVTSAFSRGKASSDALLLEQGKILTSDKKIYLKNNPIISGLSLIGISGTTGIDYHEIVGDGVITYTVGDEVIYQRIYTRVVPGGSLF